MTHATFTRQDRLPSDRDRVSRRLSPRLATAAVAMSLCAAAGAWTLDARRPAPPAAVASPTDFAPVPAPQASAPHAPAPQTYIALFDPTYSLGPVPAPIGDSAPLASALVASAGPEPQVLAMGESPVPVAEAAPPAMAEPVDTAPVPLPVPAPTLPHLQADVPLPAPRPPEIRFSAIQAPMRPPLRPMARIARTAIAAAMPVDHRSFFEKVFGIREDQPRGPALAYAEPESGLFGGGQRLTSSPMVPPDRYTAVYDISAHTVYMPNGARLEAHSGLGNLLDDPRSVRERNRGATPPSLYDLRPREQLFHGVQALRLTPVGGGNVYGRVGLLAHTYMLGPNGDSNGCVSFRDYKAFLQAYANGDIRRLAVVARRT